jgi:hypothetical protein
MQFSAAGGDERIHMVFIEKDSFRNLRRLPTDAFRSIPRLPLEDLVLPVAASDLVAWYPFRAGTGEDITAGDSRFGDATDYSAVVNGPTFKPSGGTTDIQTGANSGAFDFDGVDDVLTAGTVPINGDMTVCCHANLTNLQGFSKTFRTLVAQGDFNSSGFALYYDDSGTGTDTSDDRLTFGGGGGLRRAPINYTVGTFSFFAARLSGTSVTLFQDGNTLSINQSQGTVSVSNSGDTTRIGFDGVTDRRLEGVIDGVRIYDAALSDSQINQIYLNTEP